MEVQDHLGPHQEVLQLQPLHGHLPPLLGGEAHADDETGPGYPERGGRVLCIMQTQGPTIALKNCVILLFVFGTTPP